MLAIPLALGALSSFLTRDGMKAFESISKPPLSPPDRIFPIVWTILFALLGVASYLVLTSKSRREEIRKALTLYGVQLAFNFVWTIIYFNFGQYLFAFIWLVILWILILLTTVRFFRVRTAGGILMLPYLLWVAFAGYLNYGIYVLNVI